MFLIISFIFASLNQLDVLNTLVTEDHLIFATLIIYHITCINASTFSVFLGFLILFSCQPTFQPILLPFAACFPVCLGAFLQGFLPFFFQEFSSEPFFLFCLFHEILLMGLCPALIKLWSDLFCFCKGFFKPPFLYLRMIS